MKWRRRRSRAEGGVVRPGEPMRVVAPGMVVVPAAMLRKYGREYLEALNGGQSEVISAEEAMEQIEDEDEEGES